MKKIFLAIMLTVTGLAWAQAQMVPAPDKYNQFLEQLTQVPAQNSVIIADATLKALANDSKGYRQMLNLAEERFGNPADSIHNELLYIAFMQSAVNDYVLGNDEKERHRLLLMGALKNQIGHPAADIDYVTPDNLKQTHYLHEITTPQVLLYFNDPNCESCEKVKKRLGENELIASMVRDGKLTVLSIYPFDDQKKWLKTQYPSVMVNGYNASHSIEFNELYDLPSLPVFYLLDQSHNVILKNEASLNNVLKALSAPAK